MMRALWIAKTGMDAQQVQMDHITHNLANVGTYGYKRSNAVFEDLLYQNLRQAGAQSGEGTQLPTGLQVGVGVRAIATSRDLRQGNLQETQRPFDLAINGGGYFPIQMPDGTTGYTRDGAFQIDAQGTMVTSNGFPLVPQITVPANTTKVTITNDGTVSAMVAGQTDPVQVGQVQLTSFTNPAGLDPRGQNLFFETPSSGTPQISSPGENGAGTLRQGYVETSNVNVVEELVTMIQTQRAFEINSKAVTTSDQMLGRVTQL